MKCPFCGRDFDEEQAAAACRKCTLFGGCKMLRCPNCGYESPPEPAWIRRIKERRRKHDDHPPRN